MSGESVVGLLGAKSEAPAVASPFTGRYAKHLSERAKPSYSTFFEKDKTYDGTNVRFYKQREAVIGKEVSGSVQPSKFLKKGGGVRHVVPPRQREVVRLKPPVDHGTHGHDLYHFSNLDDGTGTGDVLPGVEGKDGGAERDGGGKTHMSGDTGADKDNCDVENNEFDDGARQGGGVHAQKSDVSDTNRVSEGDGAVPFGGHKNFVQANVIEVSNMVPKRRRLQPRFATERKSFAKVPEYSERVKAERACEEKLMQDMEAQKQGQRQAAYANFVSRLSEDERQVLVAKLRKKLESKSALFNKIPLAVNTATMRKTKGELESAIRDIESALRKLDREAIFVYRDDPVNGQWTKAAALAEARQYAVARAQDIA